MVKATPREALSGILITVRGRNLPRKCPKETGHVGLVGLSTRTNAEIVLKLLQMRLVRAVNPCGTEPLTQSKSSRNPVEIQSKFPRREGALAGGPKTDNRANIVSSDKPQQNLTNSQEQTPLEHTRRNRQRAQAYLTSIWNTGQT